MLSASLVMLLLASSPSAQSPSQIKPGPSFTCKAEQGVIEVTICASPELSAADREMAVLYAANRMSALSTGESNELNAQHEALKEMQGCAQGRSAAKIGECLQASYDIRNYELALGVVTRSPELALPVIRRVDPVFAPIAEAISLWASEPAGTNWRMPTLAAKRKKILALLKPTMTDLLTKRDEAFARENLSESSGEGVNVTKLEDILLSDRHFAVFLNVLGPALNNDGIGVSSRVVPCGAIVRHPALLGATASVYGDTMDSHVFNTDCEATLPAIPAFNTLDAKLKKNWPDCDGTIRFAAYRTYDVAVDSARMGFTRHDPNATLVSRAGVNAHDIAAAREELSAYYMRYLGKAREEADTMASDAIIAVLDNAHECE